MLSRSTPDAEKLSRIFQSSFHSHPLAAVRSGYLGIVVTIWTLDTATVADPDLWEVVALRGAVLIDMAVELGVWKKLTWAA